MEETLKHPDADWIIEITEKLCCVALSNTNSEFTRSSRQVVKWIENDFAALQSINLNATVKPEVDKWSSHVKQFGMQLEALHLAGYGVKNKDLESVFDYPLGYAGFRTHAFLELGSIFGFIGLDDYSNRAFEEARRAAHNIQNDYFCLITTARINGLIDYWNRISNNIDIKREIEKMLSSDPNDHLALHIVNESFQYRVRNEFKAILKPEYTSANSLLEISYLYELDLIQLQTVNPNIQNHSNIKENTPVYFPDMDMQLGKASLLTARILKEPTEMVSELKKAFYIQQLLPLALDSPTVLDRFLRRLILLGRENLDKYPDLKDQANKFNSLYEEASFSMDT